MIKQIFLIPLLLLAFTSCERGEMDGMEESASVENPMLFSIGGIAQTRVSYGEQENGGVSATFDNHDEVGIYAYYNNFYFHYWQYDSFAESVIFSNQGVEVDSSSETGTTYPILRSWTFSTLYGTAPHTLDCVAYYPFRTGYNPEYVNMVHDNSGAATLEYRYVERESVTSTDENGDEVDTGRTRVTGVNYNVDFMTAHTRYDENQGNPAAFREAMLTMKSIPLEFARQLASLNLQVTKPDSYDDKIEVTELKFYLHTYEKFTYACSANVLQQNKVQWLESSRDKVNEEGTVGEYLTFTVTLDDSDEGELKMTNWAGTPDADQTHEVTVMLAAENMPIVPPDSEIWRIDFSLRLTASDGGTVTTGSYTWHPHMTSIEANTNYTLHLELDPERDN